VNAFAEIRLQLSHFDSQRSQAALNVDWKIDGHSVEFNEVLVSLFEFSLEID
jgi:hypothetical protein